MATNNLRINVVLKKSTYKSIADLAKMNHTSLSSEVNFLVKEAVELHEDTALGCIAGKRDKSKKLISHKEAWK
ncbi:MAG: hypothetical protein A2452_03645 [Candidatus Firestonebacteria bacterium RIFOXYC2_FULL_39_67]|nr:MAG: hypothetical protein A2536_00470 [Candidatus Firestonebacteria bacterium RIFOXYD2_FULL_39_29]OGF51932.1 MAG: hypothetical protein A2497_07615 [Candidatus Firestonebacteria bacterium RifOxyC12_full_39_7]OGF57096.1 MAG: hypothetical protein A2452_03645 [Candidatus Firestonebacteria bacterium RIFOXYC2_FULL_39_67]